MKALIEKGNCWKAIRAFLWGMMIGPAVGGFALAFANTIYALFYFRAAIGGALLGFPFYMIGSYIVAWSYALSSSLLTAFIVLIQGRITFFQATACGLLGSLATEMIRIYLAGKPWNFIAMKMIIISTAAGAGTWYMMKRNKTGLTF